MSPNPLECLNNPPTQPGRKQGRYSVIIPNTETPSKGATRRCGQEQCSVGPVLAIRGCYTSYEVFRNGVAEAPKGPCLGHRETDSRGVASPFIFQTYLEVEDRIDHLASGLEHVAATPRNEEGMKLLGIYSRNRPEWVIAEQAAFCHSTVTVPFYDTLGPDTVEFVVRQTGLSTMVCSGQAELAKVVEVALGGKCPSLRIAVVVDMFEVGQELRERASTAGLMVYGFSELEQIGAEHPVPHRPPASTDIATFCYTSGTTGDPKGALITHANLISDAAAGDMMTAGAFSASVEDMYLSYLPLPHIFERQVQIMILAAGAPIGFFRGNPLLLIEDIIALQPTVMPAVPRVLNRLHDKITAGMLGAAPRKASTFVRACKAKVAGLHRGSSTHALWDRILFNKLKSSLGMGRLRLMITGSAPIATHVLTFMRILLGVPVLEGYGQTETTAGATLTQVGDFSSGHVGGPFPCTEICLMDVPEMGYSHTDSWHGKDPRKGGGGGGEPCQGRGEICFRGTNVFRGYYKMPDKTKEAIDADGWLHSGDIGLWTAHGALKIVDRKKNIFKLAQGEYVAPEKIENVHTQSRLVAQSFVYGDSLQSYLVCVIVPDPDAAAAWAAAEGAPSGEVEALCENSKFQQAVMEEVRATSMRANLQGFEHVRAIHLEPVPFSTENNVLTPTFKLKRKEAFDKYSHVIERLYKQGPGGVAPSSRL